MVYCQINFIKGGFMKNIFVIICFISVQFIYGSNALAGGWTAKVSSTTIEVARGGAIYLYQ